MAHKEELGEVARWAKGIVRAHACIADGYGVPEPRRQARDYLRGLFSPVERKNGWQPGGAVGGVKGGGTGLKGLARRGLR